MNPVDPEVLRYHRQTYVVLDQVGLYTAGVGKANKIEFLQGVRVYLDANGLVVAAQVPQAKFALMFVDTPWGPETRSFPYGL